MSQPLMCLAAAVLAVSALAACNKSETPMPTTNNAAPGASAPATGASAP